MSNQIVRAFDVLEKSGVIENVLTIMPRKTAPLYVQIDNGDAVRKLAEANGVEVEERKERMNGTYGRLYINVCAAIDGAEYVGVKHSESRENAHLSAAKVAFIRRALGDDMGKIALISCDSGEIEVFLPQGGEAVRRIAAANCMEVTKIQSAIEENGIKRESAYIAVFVGGMKFCADEVAQ